MSHPCYRCCSSPTELVEIGASPAMEVRLCAVCREAVAHTPVLNAMTTAMRDRSQSSAVAREPIRLAPEDFSALAVALLGSGERAAAALAPEDQTATHGRSHAHTQGGTHVHAR